MCKSSLFSFISHASWMVHATRFLKASSSEEIRKALAALSLKADEALDKKRLKKRYLELTIRYHPDTGGDVEKMKNITAAYETLKGLSRMPSENSRERAPPSHQVKYAKRAPQNPIFDDRGMPTDWINMEVLRRMAQKESGFPTSHVHPMFYQPLHNTNYQQFSFPVTFYRALYAYFFVAIVAYIILRILERFDQSDSPAHQTPFNRLNEAEKNFRRKVDVAEGRKRTNKNDNKSFFTVRREEDKSSRNLGFQKVPSAIRGVDYYYPIKEK